MQHIDRTILNVSELNAEVNLLLKQGFPLLWVEGEISNFSRPASGHFYFSLKDAGAQIRCAMFKNRNRHSDITPENGVKIVARGRIGLYETRGDFQLIVDYMEDAGVGLLQKQFEALKTKLAKKKWFDPFIKKEIPTFPQKIGIVSSPTAAALQDILIVLKRRCPQIPVLIYPTTVQGENAAIEIETAVRQADIDKKCDVLIIARGGGSIEDLAAFNNENLAQALYDTQIPIVSGIGHEIDITIADFIADKRAATPSAAAELVSPDNKQLKYNLHHLEQQINRAMTMLLTQKNQQFIGLKKRLKQQQPTYLLQQQAQDLDGLERRLKQQMQRILGDKQNILLTLKQPLEINSPKHSITKKQQKLTQHITVLNHSITTTLNNKKATLALQLAKLDTLSPLKTLERGYAIVQNETHQHLISSVSHVKTGDKVSIKVKDGEIISTVNSYTSSSLHNKKSQH
jgi:exodeoxyribonuclease VII large subunit